MDSDGSGFGFNDYQNHAVRVLSEAKVPAPARRGPRDLPTGWWPNVSILRVVLLTLAVVVLVGWVLTALNS